MNGDKDSPWSNLHHAPLSPLLWARLRASLFVLGESSVSKNRARSVYLNSPPWYLATLTV